MPTRPAYHVLVVDDNAANAKLLRLTLQGGGHRVAVAADAAEALQLVGAAQFDAALVDVRLPGMDGLELVRRLRHDARTAGIPMIVVSASASTDAEARALRAGADAFVRKPVDTRKLLRQVQAMLEPHAGHAPTHE